MDNKVKDKAVLGKQMMILEAQIGGTWTQAIKSHDKYSITFVDNIKIPLEGVGDVLIKDKQQNQALVSKTGKLLNMSKFLHKEFVMHLKRNYIQIVLCT